MNAIFPEVVLRRAARGGIGRRRNLSIAQGFVSSGSPPACSIPSSFSFFFLHAIVTQVPLASPATPGESLHASEWTFAHSFEHAGLVLSWPNPYWCDITC
jgi:hypothetical protein